MSEVNDLSEEQLELEIQNSEKRLQELRTQYMKKTGHLPARSLNDTTWRWTIFMTLGFAFITSMVYLIGIRHSGRDLSTGIPSFFFQTDFAYFAILTFYMILCVLVVQFDKLSGYQTWAVILGFWCAHWLIYDWAWWAIEGGFGHLAERTDFWNENFGYDLLVVDPPMWLFLTEALIGATTALYTFTVVDKYKALLPPAIWLFAAYANPEICKQLGVDASIIQVMAIIFLCVQFSLMGIFTYKRLKKGRPSWIPSRNEIRNRFKRENWTFNPMSLPWILVIVVMLTLMHLFLILIPVIGLFLGMIPWFFLPLYFILFRSSDVMNSSKKRQYIFAGLLVGFFVLLVVFMTLAA